MEILLSHMMKKWLNTKKTNSKSFLAKGGPDDIIIFGVSGTGFSIFKDGLFTNYGAKDGLQDPRVNCIDIDSGGNIWIGTDGSGVVKFDGKKFHQYTRNDGILIQRYGIYTLMITIRFGLVHMAEV